MMFLIRNINQWNSATDVSAQVCKPVELQKMVTTVQRYSLDAYAMWILWPVMLFSLLQTESAATGSIAVSKEIKPATAIACEGKTMTISCPVDQFIHILRANYGRFSLLECNEEGQTWDNAQCMYDKSTRIMQERCQYRRSCHVPANDQTFSDECPGTSKYLQVTYECKNDSTSYNQRIMNADSSMVVADPQMSWNSTRITTDTGRSSSHCPETVHRGQTWPSTCVNNTARISCPNTNERHSYAEWYCSPDGSWCTSHPDLSHCVSQWAQDVKRNAAEVSKASDITPIIEELQSKTSLNMEIYGGDVSTSSQALLSLSKSDPVKNGSEGMKDDQVIRIMESFTEIGSNLLQKEKSDAWLEIGTTARTNAADALLSAVETMSVAVAARTSVVSSGIHYESSQIGYEISIPNEAGRPYLTFPSSDWKSDASDNIQLPSSLLKHDSNGSNQAPSVIFVYYDRILGDYLSPPTKRLGDEGGNNITAAKPHVVVSNLITATLVALDHSSGKHQVSQFSHLSEPIIITVTKRLDINGSKTLLCAYWDPLRTEWSMEGCWKRDENITHISCACNHLTTFAVLMDVHGVIHDEQHQLALLFVTYVGCIISIICCGLAATAFWLQQSVIHPDRNVIHINLCVCLLLAELVFVLGINRTNWPFTCSAVAASLHYLFLAAFAWMFLEGVQLYILLIRVFQSTYNGIRYMYIFSYGVPLVIVGISVSIDHRGYGTDRHCWLQTENYFAYSFVGPVAVVVLANVVFLIMALVVLCRHINYTKSCRRDDDQSTNIDTIFMRLKGAVALVVLLGLTWTLGPLYIIHPTVSMAYAFSILNSLQGAFIFVFHVLANSQVRHEIRVLLRAIFIKRKGSLWSGSSASTYFKRSKSSCDEPTPMMSISIDSRN